MLQGETAGSHGCMFSFIGNYELFSDHHKEGMRDPVSLDLYHHLVFSLFSNSGKYIVISHCACFFFFFILFIVCARSSLLQAGFSLVAVRGGFFLLWWLLFC